LIIFNLYTQFAEDLFQLSYLNAVFACCSNGEKFSTAVQSAREIDTDMSIRPAVNGFSFILPVRFSTVVLVGKAWFTHEFQWCFVLCLEWNWRMWQV